ncbi:MAG: SpoIIE family protein phosphatase [Cellulomonas sp.]
MPTRTTTPSVPTPREPARDGADPAAPAVLPAPVADVAGPTVVVAPLDAAAPAPRSLAERLAALEQLGTVTGAVEPRFDRVVRLARQLFDVPTATVSLVGVGEPAPAPMVVPAELAGTPAPGRDGVAVLEDRGPDARLRFYAEHPLVGADGRTLGTLCIADTRPRRFTADQSALLRDLAHWVAKELSVDAELERAQQVQMGLLPRESPRVDGYELAGACLPSSQVGGDFYDWYPAADGVVLTLADVMGKGPAAAILAAAVRAVLRGSAQGESVDRAMLQAGAVLHADLSGAGLFATAFHARLEAATGRVTYADAGHGLTLVVRADGSWERLDALGLPLGVTDEATRDLGETHLGPGDLLLAFSDGVLDLFDGSLRCVPLLVGELLDCPSADEAVQRVLRLAAVSASRPDDVTVVALRRSA